MKNNASPSIKNKAQAFLLPLVLLVFGALVTALLLFSPSAAQDASGPDLSVTISGPDTVPRVTAVEYALIGVAAVDADSATNVQLTGQVFDSSSDPAVLTSAMLVTGQSCDISRNEAGRYDYACDLGDLNPGDEAEVTLSVDVPQDFDAGNFKVKARIDADERDADSADNKDRLTAVVPPKQNDLTLDIVGPPLMPRLTVVEYAIAGAAAVDGDEAENTVISGELFDSSDDTSVVLNSVALVTGESCDTTPTTRGVAFECEVGTLQPGDEAEVIVSANIPADFDAKNFKLKARIDSDAKDFDTSNNKPRITTGVIDNLIRFDKKGPDSIQAGDDARYTLILKNNTTEAYSDVVVTDALDDALFETAPTNIQTNKGTCEVDSTNALSCDLGDVLPSEKVTIKFDATVSSNTNGAERVQNEAEARGRIMDTDFAKESGFTSNVNTSEDPISIDITTPSDPLAGTVIEYAISGLNNSDDTATEVELDFELGSAFAAGGPVAAQTENGSCDVDSAGLLTCQLDDLAAGEGFEVVVFGALPLAVADGDDVSAMAASRSRIKDTDFATESASAASASNPGGPTADLSLTDFDWEYPSGGGSAGSGDLPIEFELEITNSGADSAQVTLNNLFDRPVQFDSATTNTGAPVNCSDSLAGVTCDLTLPPGGTETVFVVVVTPPSSDDSDSIENSIVITSNIGDPDLANNTAGISAVVTDSNIILEKTGPETAAAGSTYVFTVKATNASSTAQNGTLTDLISDPNLTFVAARSADSEVDCSASGSTGANCSITGLAPGAEVEMTIETLISATVAPGTTISNDAEVTDQDGDGMSNGWEFTVN